MQDIFQIDGQDVPFKANGMTVVRYQERYGSDLFKDLARWQTAIQSGETFSTDILINFMHFAHTMAYQADNTIDEDAYSWVDRFEVFPIDELMPKLVDLWLRSTVSNTELKKKAKA